MRRRFLVVTIVLGLAIVISRCFSTQLRVQYDTLRYIPTWRRVVATGDIYNMAYFSTIIRYKPPYRVEVPEWWIPSDVREQVLAERERLADESRMEQYRKGSVLQKQALAEREWLAVKSRIEQHPKKSVLHKKSPD